MIVEIDCLKREDIESTILDSKKEGYRHVSRLINDYESGQNRFKRHGEKLIGYQVNGKIVAICGLNIEPDNSKLGRIRRLYVLPEYRNQGVGYKLVKHLIKYAKNYFSAVTVNIGNLQIEEFYIKLGFVKECTSTSYSHILKSAK